MNEEMTERHVSARGHRWAIRPAGSASRQILTGLKQGESSLSPDHQLGSDLSVLANILAQRDFQPSEAGQFLAPYDYRFFHEHVFPELLELDDLKPAITRLADAVEKGQKIGISSDYDCDGNCSLALMRRTLRACGVDVEHDVVSHIPNRKREGYGVNVGSVRQMKEQGVQLLLTLDNGTVAHTAIAEAVQLLKTDDDPDTRNVIIVDHHPNSEGQALPEQALIVNPHRQPPPADPKAQTAKSLSNDLAAVGLTYVLCQGVVDELQARGWFSKKGLQLPDMRKHLGVVALASVADVVKLGSPLSRMMLSEGLRVMNHEEDPALARLCESAGCDIGSIDSEILAFRLGPIINASGRMADSIGWRMLSLKPEEIHIPSRSADFVTAIRHNEARKDKEAELLLKLEPEIQAHIHDPVLVLPIAEEGYEGVVGIVASRVMERTGKPAIVLSQLQRDDGSHIYVGSARSPKYEQADGSLKVCDIGTQLRHLQSNGVLIKGGGHPFAGGCSLEEHRITEFRQAINAALGEKVKAFSQHQVTPIAGVLDISRLPLTGEIFKDAHLRDLTAHSWIERHPRGEKSLIEWMETLAGKHNKATLETIACTYLDQPEKAFAELLAQNTGRARSQGLKILSEMKDTRPGVSTLISLRLNALSWAIDAMGPYGEGNPKPLFIIPNMYIDHMRFMGRNEQGEATQRHFRMTLRSADNPALHLSAVAYHAGGTHLGEEILAMNNEHKPIHALASIGRNKGGGITLQIQDIIPEAPNLEQVVGKAGLTMNPLAPLYQTREHTR